MHPLVVFILSYYIPCSGFFGSKGKENYILQKIPFKILTFNVEIPWRQKREGLALKILELLCQITAEKRAREILIFL